MLNTSSILNTIINQIECTFVTIQRSIDSYRNGYSMFDTREGYPY